jgi:predicted transcriptional regulator
MERANIMQNRLDMAREQLGRKQEAFQKKRRTLDEQQAFEVEVTDDTFRIKVMEKRLSEHEDTAIAKYKVSFMEQYSLTCFMCCV